MKVFRQIIGGWGICILLVSCLGEQQNNDPNSYIDEYFNVRGLLAENLEKLREREVVLEKEASFSGEVEKTSIRLDSLALAEEFEVFRELDINKPEFSERYSETRQQVNGQEVITYEADDKETLNINYLKVYKDLSSGRVSQIEALFSNKNILYNSTRAFSLYFGQVEGELLPTSYSIDGKQKMIFSDSEAYQIRSNFIYQD